MSKEFFSYWFKGLDKAISKLDDKNVEIMLSECGKACSESYTKQIYIDEYAKAKNLEDFLVRLRDKFPEMQINKKAENVIEIIYTFCACDIVKKGYIANPRFCICSQKSLLTNWEAILGESNVKVLLNKSILAQVDCCKFTVEILSSIDR